MTVASAKDITTARRVHPVIGTLLSLPDYPAEVAAFVGGRLQQGKTTSEHLDKFNLLLNIYPNSLNPLLLLYIAETGNGLWDVARNVLRPASGKTARIPAHKEVRDTFFRMSELLKDSRERKIPICSNELAGKTYGYAGRSF